MHLTPRESEKLLLFLAGELGPKKKGKGIKIKLSRGHCPYQQ
jgi:urease subunit gamma